MALTNVLGDKLSSLGNIVLGGVVKSLRAGAGSFPAPVVPYFAFRILDPVSGAVVIANLPFLSAKWGVRGLQPGNVGASSLGNFEIGLPPPTTPAYQKRIGVYGLLAEGQRVEAYIVPSPGVAPAGVPWQSGVIRSLPSAFNDFSIKGVDSLFLLQASRTSRTDFFTGRTDQLAAYALRTFQLTYGDDFATASLTTYAQLTGIGLEDGTGALRREDGSGIILQEVGTWSASTDEGLSVATVAGDSVVPSLLLTNGSFAQNTYADMVIDDYFRLRFATNASVQHGLVAAYASGVYVVGYMVARFINSAKWEVDLVIASVANGLITKRVTKTVVVVEPTQGIRAQLALVGKQGTQSGSSFVPDPAGPDYLWRLTINGVDVGCTWIQAATTPSGSIGLLYSVGASDSGTATSASSTTLGDTAKSWQSGIFVGGTVTMSGKTGTITANTDKLLTVASWVGGTPSLSTYSITPPAASGSPQLWATQFFMRSRLPAFQTGVSNVGGRSIIQYIPRTAGLDLLNYASVTEGNVYRKSARVGLNQDVVDWGPSVGSEIAGETPVGTDSLVRFEKGKNLLDLQLEENSESLASDIALQVSPSGDQAGLLEWHLLPAIKKYGILTDTVQAQYLADFLGARALAEAIGSTRSVPGVSKRFTVLRDKATAGLWREMDYVVVNWPEKGIVNRRVQVLEYTLTHGKPEVEIVGDKFPAADFGVELARLWQTLDQVAIGSASVTPSSVAAGVVYDSRFGSPNVLPFYGPYLSVDPTHNYRMRFQIPANVVMIQKVTLAFSLLPYRTYSSFTISATGGASVSHTHVMTHSHSHNHDLILDNATGGSTVNVPLNRISVAGGLTDSSAISTNAQGSSSSSTGGQSADHTHTVSGSSTLGIDEGTSAQGVHVFVDDVDITGTLGGPWSGSGQSTDFGEFDITPYVLGGSWHEIQFSSTTLGAIVAQGMMFIIAKPTV